MQYLWLRMVNGEERIYEEKRRKRWERWKDTMR